MCAHQVRSYVQLVSTDDRTNEPSHGQPTADHRSAQRWAAWFDGLTLTADDDGTTVICGPVVDQSALHGVLQKLRDLGITLLSVTSSATPPAITQPQNPCTHTNHRPTGASS